MNHTDKPSTYGEAYERQMGRWSRVVGRAFIDWLDAPRDLRWLDVGCGNGAFTEELIAHCAPTAVAAIDPSVEQVSYARQRRKTQVAEFRVGGARALPFPDGSFDVAVMALVIAFVPEPVKAVREMTRVVRAGGLIATYMWDILAGGVPIDPLYKAITSLGIATTLPPSAEISKRDALRQLWERAGLQVVDTQVFRIPVAYSNFDDFWDSNAAPAGPQGKLIESMSPSMKEKLRKRLFEYLPIASDGRIVYESVANAVQGRVPI